MPRQFGACFAAAVILIAGCGEKPRDSPTLAKVSGTVNLDRAKMQGGEVRFSLDGQPPKVLEIKDGAFSGEAYVGKNKVEVVWDKDGPPNPMDPNGPRVKVNAVASQFSGANTSLTADVNKGGSTDLKFDVTSARR